MSASSSKAHRIYSAIVETVIMGQSIHEKVLFYKSHSERSIKRR